MAVLALSVVSSLLAVSVVRSLQVTVGSLSASAAVLQAQQYAAAEGDIVRMTAYADLRSVSKTEIPGTFFSKEVFIGTESDYTDTIKKKIVTVKIYKDTDILPCYSLTVPRFSTDVNGKGVPIGTVIIWASNNAPQENGVWLECNGQSCAAYPELAKVLGKNTVPDYRGVFLRGLGSVTSSHYGTVDHQSNSLGELQGDAIRNITGYASGAGFICFDAYSGAMWSRGRKDGTFWVAGRNVVPGDGIGAYIVGSDGRYPDDVAIDVSLVVPTANENRPINRAVRYFIRAA